MAGKIKWWEDHFEWGDKRDLQPPELDDFLKLADQFNLPDKTVWQLPRLVEGRWQSWSRVRIFHRSPLLLRIETQVWWEAIASFEMPKWQLVHKTEYPADSWSIVKPMAFPWKRPALNSMKYCLHVYETGEDPLKWFVPGQTSGAGGPKHRAQARKRFEEEGSKMLVCREWNLAKMKEFV